MADRTRWYLEKALLYAEQAVDGRSRLGDAWAADPVGRAGLTHLVEAVAEYLGHVPDELRAEHPRTPTTRSTSASSTRRSCVTSRGSSRRSRRCLPL